MSRAVFPVAFDTGYQPTPAQIQQTLAARDPNRTGFDTDPMLKRSADSAAMVEYWDLTDTLVDGINALRLAGEKYLPRFVDEDGLAYDFRLKMTKMTNIYRDTVEGLASKPFEQEITLVVDDGKTAPPELIDFIEDVDGSGNNLTVFGSGTFYNGINSAIDWIFVDYPEEDPTVRTIADVKARGIRPYWSRVLGRNVFEPRSKVVRGEEILTYMKIFEPGKPDHIREFEALPNGTVVWRLYERRDQSRPMEGGETRFWLINEGVVSIGVIPLVPFITGRRDGRSWRFFPAMRDAADLQIELYQQESALKFVTQLAGYPMLAGNGVSPEKNADGSIKKLAVGPGRVLYAPTNSNGHSGTWTFVEPAATTMTFLAANIKETQMQARELGRQPLTAQSGNLTVITTAVAANKGKSAVKGWALGLKDALENALVITEKWMGLNATNYDPVVNVFTEFDEFLEGKDLDVLQAARKEKDISQLTYWEELKRRAVLSPEFDAEVEEQRLLEELPGDGEDTNDINEPPVKDA